MVQLHFRVLLLFFNCFANIDCVSVSVWHIWPYHQPEQIAGLNSVPYIFFTKNTKIKQQTGNTNMETCSTKLSSATLIQKFYWPSFKLLCRTMHFLCPCCTLLITVLSDVQLHVAEWVVWRSDVTEFGTSPFTVLPLSWLGRSLAVSVYMNSTTACLGSQLLPLYYGKIGQQLSLILLLIRMCKRVHLTQA